LKSARANSMKETKKYNNFAKEHAMIVKPTTAPKIVSASKIAKLTKAEMITKVH